MPQVHVIGLPQSNYVWAVRIALAEKGVPHINTPAQPHSPEVCAVHPLGKIPILRHGDVALGESSAIIDYIDRRFDGPRLIPVDDEAMRRSGMWTSLITTSLEPLIVRQYVLAYMFPDTEDGKPDRGLIEALIPKIEAALDLLEAALASGAIGGGRFDRTDAYLIPILFYTRNTPEGASMLSAKPRLTAYLERGLARPSVQATMPPQSPGGA